VIDYDSELRALRPHLRAAAGVEPGERVLDVGCGAGQSTRDAARDAAPGPVVGIDTDAQLLERARRLTADAGLDNATYVLGDAQVHAFPRAEYDVAISRFGTMFFADPTAAFANIGRALRPHGRLALLVWQARERNAWAIAIDRALADPPPSALDPFSLGEPATVTRTLADAGFDGIELDEVHEPIFYGADSAEALEFVSAFQCTRTALAAMSPADADQALERLRRMLDEHRTPEGVAFDSRAWVITGRRAA
jgi:ubiquinone/menaquinone biosynthesis C-methylase UbiE